MTIKVSRYIQEDTLEEQLNSRSLPDLFRDDKDNFLKYVVTSVILHPAAIGLIALSMYVLALLGVDFSIARRPEIKNKDIEFVLTQNEATPIDKNTKYRSDKNSRAGGIHDPNRKVSMPSSPAPAPQPAQKPAQPAPKQQAQKPVQKPAAVPKPVKQPAPVQPAQTVNKPSKIAAPTQKPVLKPSSTTPKPQMPKVTSAPASPFRVEVPKVDAPVGKGFSTSGGTSSTGGTAGGTSTKSGGGSSMPAPQFSTTRTASAGSGASRGVAGGTGRGGYGTGNMGNPGPGNPSGAPGIDAIKSPQWGPYMRELESKIKRNWHPPKGDQSKRVVLLFKIGKRGELLSIKVAKTSGSQANDQAATAAVQMSAPFRALPPEFTGSSVEIEFTFDYNVLGASYR